MINRVYWTEAGQINHQDFDDVVASLKFTQALRKNNKVSLIATAINEETIVGGFGVDGVENGKLPSGEPYGWKKRRPWHTKVTPFVPAATSDALPLMMAFKCTFPLSLQAIAKGWSNGVVILYRVPLMRQLASDALMPTSLGLWGRWCQSGLISWKTVAKHIKPILFLSLSNIIPK